MVFSSNVFLFVFLPAVLGVYYLCPRRMRNGVLLIFSLLFYGWGEPVYLFLMLGVVVLDFLCGLWIHRSGKPGLIAGIVSNLLILGFFKYSGLGIPLPVGISFYIFQSMSYLIDLYRQKTRVQKSLATFATYVTLFPQLIAGPIVRYVEVEDQLRERRESPAMFASGAERFVAGLSKKLLLANPMGELWLLMQEQPGTLCAWMGLLACTLQIYFDFSGYSDMAIGLGRMFGFEFPENFRYPYLSASITEFWRRWHITLGSWFREYVYIPLGGSRRGTGRQIVNILTVWMLTGLWHGASLNFVLWGGYYGILLILEKLLLRRVRIPKLLGRAYTIPAVMLGWALFSFEDFTALGAFLRRLFTLASSARSRTLLLGWMPITAIAILASTPLFKNYVNRHRESAVLRWGIALLCCAALLLCTAALARQSYNPFIYFRF